MTNSQSELADRIEWRRVQLGAFALSNPRTYDERETDAPMLDSPPTRQIPATMHSPANGFRVGPLIVRIVGDDLVTPWAGRVFDPLRDDREPDVVFQFVDSPVHPCRGRDVVGEERVAVGGGQMSFRGRHFDVRIRRESRIEVDLYRRDRRASWRRWMADPEEAWKIWLSHGSGLDMHALKEFAYSVLPLVLQCALLERGAALIHASGFRVGDAGVLLPAWGGVGKSTMVSRAVLHGSAMFLADDHAVIDSSGAIHLYTLPIHIYGYHIAQDALLRHRVLDAIGRYSRLQWPIGRRLRRNRAVRWVAPQDVFHRKALADSAALADVVVMFRGQGDQFEYVECSPEDVADPCAGVMMREIGLFMDRIAAGGAGWSAGPFPGIAEVQSRLRAVYCQAFSRATCARVLVPRGANADDLAKLLSDRCERMANALRPTHSRSNMLA